MMLKTKAISCAAVISAAIVGTAMCVIFPADRKTVTDVPAVIVSARNFSQRRGVSVINDGSAKCYLSIGVAALAGKGIMLSPNGGSMTVPSIDEAIYAVCLTNETTGVSVQEW